MLLNTSGACINEVDSLHKDLILKSFGIKVLILGNNNGNYLLLIQSKSTTLVVTALDNFLICSLERLIISYSNLYNSDDYLRFVNFGEPWNITMFDGLSISVK